MTARDRRMDLSALSIRPYAEEDLWVLELDEKKSWGSTPPLAQPME